MHMMLPQVPCTWAGSVRDVPLAHVIELRTFPKTELLQWKARGACTPRLQGGESKSSGDPNTCEATDFVGNNREIIWGWNNAKFLQLETLETFLP